jgi:hypothetical protein
MPHEDGWQLSVWKGRKWQKVCHLLVELSDLVMVKQGAHLKLSDDRHLCCGRVLSSCLRVTDPGRGSDSPSSE